MKLGQCDTVIPDYNLVYLSWVNSKKNVEKKKNKKKETKKERIILKKTIVFTIGMVKPN
jgi:hypothetical protein